MIKTRAQKLEDRRDKRKEGGTAGRGVRDERWRERREIGKIAYCRLTDRANKRQNESETQGEIEIAVVEREQSEAEKESEVSE